MYALISQGDTEVIAPKLYKVDAHTPAECANALDEMGVNTLQLIAMFWLNGNMAWSYHGARRETIERYQFWFEALKD